MRFGKCEGDVVKEILGKVVTLEGARIDISYLDTCIAMGYI
jgi:hypothetical protein